MLVKPTMESLLKKVDGRYTLAILAAKRARQLVNGALPLSTSETPNYVTIACEEIGKGKVICVKGIHDVFVPLRPEIAAERLAAKAALENARLQEALEETFSRTELIEIDDGDDMTIEIEESLEIEEIPDVEENEVIEEVNEIAVESLIGEFETGEIIEDIVIDGDDDDNDLSLEEEV